MLKKFCHDQIKILLERMDTHPEEFIKEGKWDEFLPPETNTHRGIVQCKFKHFNKLEQYLVRAKYNKIVKSTLRQRAYDGILETLVFKEKTDYYGSTTIGALQAYTATAHISASGNLTTNTLTLGNETLDGQTIKLMKEQIMAMKKLGQI